MADQVSIPDNLKQRFSQFNSIAEVTQRLQERIVQINEANKRAAGEKDATAKAYHKQVDEPTQNLSGLVEEIAKLFGVTATRGTLAAQTLEDAAEDAREQVEAWKPPENLPK